MIKILSHSSCYDGQGASLVAWKKFGDKAQYIFCSYGDPLPKIDKGDEVYILDFSFPRDILLGWEKICSKLVLLDHHKTAEANLKGLPFVHFDMTKSGALLAWEYFFPGERVPLMIQHISDRDLWTFKIEGSRQFHSYLKSCPMEFRVWDSIFTSMETDSKFKIYGQGEGIERYQNQIVKNTVDQFSWLGYLDKDPVAVCNATCDWSEMGEYLLKCFPQASFSITYWDKPDGIRQFSLRSRTDFDVSEVAKRYNGGGHAQASGFVLPIDKAPVIKARLSTKGDMV